MSYSIEQALRNQVPPGWKLRRLKAVADVIPSNIDKHSVDGQIPVRLCNYVDAYKNETITAQLDFMAATATSAQIDRLSLCVGDIVITKDSESPWDIAVPAYVVDDIHGLVCGYHLSKISPDKKGMHGGYLAWALRSKPVNVQFSLSAQGITRYGLSSSGLSDGWVPCPSLPEQVAIASYLDAETARIDALVKEKRALLTLLEDLRVSTVREQTAGIGLQGPKQETGDQFLPKLPTDWHYVRVGRVARVGNGSTPSRQRDDFWSGGTFPWLNSSVVNQDEVVEGSELITDAALAECHLPCLRPGTVVMAMIGQGQTRGKVAVLRIEATLSQNIAYIEPDADILDGDYVFWYLTGAYHQIRYVSDGRGGNQSALSCEDVARLMIPVPPLATQRAIACRLWRVSSQLDGLFCHVEKEIAFLQELRSSTITDAVLGRVQVGP